MKGGSVSYADKEDGYFDSARSDIVNCLPQDNELTILEVGCGAGATARCIRRAREVARYVGIELMAPAAQKAEGVLDEIHVGDIEKMGVDSLGQFNVLIMSEVLEHLVDPWVTLKKLNQCLVPGATIIASSPNVSSRHIIQQLLKGKFEYESSGVMDITHLRWFTPLSYRAMFENAGFEVLRVAPLSGPGRVGRVLTWLSGGKLGHLFFNQISLIARKC